MRRKDVTKSEADMRGTARAPRQARGRERREQLLDAAAALIAESGLAAVSMHAAAERAGASIGSVYHFFRDKDQMLDALAERHDAELQPAFDRVLQRSDAEWTALSPAEMIEQLIGWAIRYFVRHPDALATLDLHDQAMHAEFRTLIDRVMRARLGAELGSHAATTFDAVVLGTLLFTREQDPRSRDVVVAALPEMMATYLTALEAKQKRAKG
ncbi:TetR/AcrR family transcriptional regulator [Bradyrhizobium sp. ORS 285]|uniref:TetR/AcrR family transcriptional regulator n=1 Tax=Bradyrhizobium sp. ORS 285 TaxID=115808 RepID=UPI0002409AE6|nr:TetR/AcrR family transcriptional regulator [Bradyrhizobium sp. ORS 285]CCD88711.1 putative transcriptional regulator, TetR family [Bradyrhizobium sp. ORS 285]